MELAAAVPKEVVVKEGEEFKRDCLCRRSLNSASLC